MSAMRSDRFSGAHVVAHAPLSPKELCHCVGRVAIWLRAQKADSPGWGPVDSCIWCRHRRPSAGSKWLINAH